MTNSGVLPSCWKAWHLDMLGRWMWSRNFLSDALFGWCNGRNYRVLQYFLSGAWSAVLIGVAPESMGGYLQPRIESICTTRGSTQTDILKHSRHVLNRSFRSAWGRTRPKFLKRSGKYPTRFFEAAKEIFVSSFWTANNMKRCEIFVTQKILSLRLILFLVVKGPMAWSPYAKPFS
jgi:hypothetical protein